MLSTSQLRVAWNEYRCKGPWARFTLFGGGVVTINLLIVEATKALNECLKAFAYEATPPDCGAYNCRQITGGTNWSLHAYAIAIDINWLLNPYGRVLVTDMPVEMRNAIKRIRTNNGKQVWGSGADYSGNKDAMHYEIVCTPADLATGINWKTVIGAPPSPIPQPPQEEEVPRKILFLKPEDDRWPQARNMNFVSDGSPETVFHIANPKQQEELLRLGLIKADMFEGTGAYTLYEVLTHNGHKPELLERFPRLAGTEPVGFNKST